MPSTNKELLEIPYPPEPKELFNHTGKLLARLDTLKGNFQETEEGKKEARFRYFHGFKLSREEISTYEEFELRIIEGISKLFLTSYNLDFFWYDCPLKVYKNTFHSRLQELKKEDPELTENNLLMRDYQVLDNFPFYGQRFLRTDNKYIGIDYGQILDKQKDDNVNPYLLQKVEDLKYKLERARKDKMNFIQEQFREREQMILKNGYEFELIDIPKLKTVEVPPPHSHIFANNGFKLFDYLIKNSITENRGRKDDIAYYYRRMYKNKFIIARPVPFIEWFSGNPYNEILGDKLKTLDQVQSTNRDREYSRGVEWLKTQ